MAVATFAVLLGLLEISFRVVGIYAGTHYIGRRTVVRSPDDRLQYELEPGAFVQAEVAYRINEHGMRDDPVSILKPEGTTRIAVIGDSIAFGLWVAMADAFPHQLESMLNEQQPSARRIEVLNFGVPGYDIAKEARVLATRAIAFDPDIVIVAFCLNDVRSVGSPEYGIVLERERRRASGGFGWFADVVRDHSVLLAWIDYRLTRRAVRKHYMQHTVSRPEAPDKDPWIDLQLAAGFGEIAKTLAEAGRVPALVAIFPTFDYPFVAYPNTWLHTRVAEIARKNGLVVVDLLPCFSGYALQDVRIDPVHPTPMGHRVGAHAIRDALAANGMLPGEAFDNARFGDCRHYRRDDFPTVRGY